MRRSVVWSRTAIDELIGIATCIAEDNVAAAERVSGRIRLTGNKLGQLAIGRVGRVGGTYEKPVPGLPYVIAYAVEPVPEEGERILIVRIIHGARDWREGEWPES